MDTIQSIVRKLGSALSNCCTLASSSSNREQLEAETHQSSSSYEDPLEARTHQSCSCDDPLEAQTHYSQSSYKDQLDAQTSQSDSSSHHHPLEAQTHLSSYEDPLEAETHQSSSSTFENPLEAQTHHSSSSSSSSYEDPLESQTQQSTSSLYEDALEVQTHQSTYSSYEDALEAQTHQSSSSHEDALEIQTHQSFASSYDDPVDVQTHQPSFSSSTAYGLSSYEVVLSYRVEDTGKNFTDHLYTSLTRAEVRTYRYDDELERGNVINPEFLKVIEKSKIFIPILSKNYARSERCLEELAKMVECNVMTGKKLFPIFFNVDPSQVRRQTGSFAEAFRKHKIRFTEEKVERWREALKEAGEITGWVLDLKEVENGYESKLISLVTREVLRHLGNTRFDVAKHPVGIDLRVEDMMRLLQVESQDVLFVGIHGMGGLGKTTIAKAVFNEIYNAFEGACFLLDVRERYLQQWGLLNLQKILLRDILNIGLEGITDVSNGKRVIKSRLCMKKVLLILDDVDHIEQLDALAGQRDWFGPGSRIIITTRDENVLRLHRVDEIYEPKELGFDQSLQLLSNYAFFKDRPPEDYKELSKEVVRTTGGLPLAIEVLGSALFGMETIEWENVLDKLKRFPGKKVQNKLKLSYDGLDDSEKQIFLDIACFFIGMDKGIAITMFKGCGFYPETRIKILVLRSLIEIGDNNELRMHDEIRDMGREIIHQENPMDPGMRSRLWMHKDALDVLMKRTGTKNIEGLCIKFLGTLNTKAFAPLSSLRFLQVNYAHLQGDWEHLPKALRWLSWKVSPLEYIPTTFHLHQLVVLDLSWSQITQFSCLHQNQLLLKNLRVLDLSRCLFLTRIGLSGLPYLERLILNYCVRLFEIDESIGHLKRLVFLDLGCCSQLVKLPSSICGLKSLETLVLSRCTKFCKLPKNLGSMEDLRELFLDHTAIIRLPNSIGFLKNLRRLSLYGCLFLSEIPNSIWRIESLIELDLAEAEIKEIPDFCRPQSKIEVLNARDCRSLSRLPDSIGNLINLKSLYIDRTIIAELPDSVGSLEKLEELKMSGCKNLVKLPDSMGKMRSLKYFDIQETGIVQLPEDLGMLSGLKKLKMDGCRRFTGFLAGSISGLCSLEELSANNCNISEGGIPSEFGRLSSLRTLELKGNNFYSLPASITALSRLQTLDLTECKMLRCLPNLPTSLTHLQAGHCRSMESLPDLSNLKRLKELHLRDCEKLAEIQGLEDLEDLEELYLRGCTSIESLSDLSNLKKLTILDLTDCRKLAKIQLNEQWKYLEQLFMGGCSSVVGNSLRRSLVLGVLEHSNLRLLTLPGSKIPDWFTPLRISHDEDDMITLYSEVPPSRRQQHEIKIMGVMLCFVFANQGKVSGTRLGVDVKRNGDHVLSNDRLVYLSPPQTHQEDQFYFFHFQEKGNDPRHSLFVSVLEEGDEISFKMKLGVKKGGIHHVLAYK